MQAPDKLLDAPKEWEVEITFKATRHQEGKPDKVYNQVSLEYPTLDYVGFVAIQAIMCDLFQQFKKMGIGAVQAMGELPKLEALGIDCQQAGALGYRAVSAPDNSLGWEAKTKKK